LQASVGHDLLHAFITHLFREDVGTGPLGVIGNVMWLVFAGWWLALGHLVTAILLAVTIVGIPFAWAHLKLAGLALWPIGKPRPLLAPGETRAYPVLPLRDIVVFPHMIAPLFVGRKKSILALEEAKRPRDRSGLAHGRGARPRDDAQAGADRVGRDHDYRSGRARGGHGRGGSLDAHRELNDRDTGAEAAVSFQNFIHSSKLGDSSRSLAETTTVPAVREVLRRDRQ
jgi:hypothetical protein